MSLVVALVLGQVEPRVSQQARRAQYAQQIDRLVPALRRMAADPAVIAAVRAQNERRVPLHTIRELDAEWQARRGVTRVTRRVLTGACAQVLRAHQRRLPVIAEAFAMDDKGALVGATRRTSDYWQGDEDKWRKVYRAGGRVRQLREKPFFDESVQDYVVHVSVPVMDDGRIIGVLTAGLTLLQL